MKLAEIRCWPKFDPVFTFLRRFRSEEMKPQQDRERSMYEKSKTQLPGEMTESEDVMIFA